MVLVLDQSNGSLGVKDLPKFPKQAVYFLHVAPPPKRLARQLLRRDQRFGNAHGEHR